MTDVMSPEARSKLMARIRGCDTGPERLLRSLLYARGHRFRKHVRGLPGRPDFVFYKTRVVVLVDGDFWHAWRFPTLEHKLSPFWAGKIRRNRLRDRSNFTRLRRQGWKVIRVWEHQVNTTCQLVAERIERELLCRRRMVPRRAEEK